MTSEWFFPAQCTAASWSEALAQSRKHRDAPREIRLAPGVLNLAEPLCLGPEDSGLTISGGAAGDTVISGALTLSGWRRDGDNAWAADLPPDAAPRLLLIGEDAPGRSALRPRARFPREKRLLCLDHPAISWQGSHGGGWNRPPHPYELTHMTVNPADWPPELDIANAEATLFHCWDESTVRIGDFDPSSGIVTFLSPAEHPAGAFHRQTYVLWNIRAGLTEPGQWMHDRVRQKIVYRPWPDEDPEHLTASIARPESLFRLLPGADRVTLRDLALDMTNAPVGNAGLRAVNPPGAVDANGCAGLTLERLHITHAGGQGVRTFQCPGLTVANCRIGACGAGGITALESMPADIRGNTVADIGRNCFSAVAITGGGKSELCFVVDGEIPESGTVRIEDNRIDGSPYCGIVCNGGPHVIRGNRITKVMQVLNDGAAIYASRADHTIIANNAIHDLTGGGDGQKHALYLDEFSHHAVLDGNLVLDCASPAHFHRAWRCTLSNNHFIHAGELTIQANRCLELTLTGNLIASRQAIRLHSNSRLGIQVKDDNRIFSATDDVSLQNDDACQPQFFYEGGRVAMFNQPAGSNPALAWRRLAILGDSITQAGFFAAELMLHLACRFPDRDLTILNAGIAGNSAAGGRERIDADLLPMRPDAVLVCFGMNDINRDHFQTPTPSHDQRLAIEKEQENFARNLRGIIDRLRRHGITPVLLSPPAYDEYSRRDVPNAPFANSFGLAKIRDLVDELAREYHLLFADPHLALSRLYHRHPELAIAGDRIHPDERGHRVMAAAIAAALFPEPPEPRGGLPFPEDDIARAIDPYCSLAALRRTGAAAHDAADATPLRLAAETWRAAEVMTRRHRQAELILASRSTGTTRDHDKIIDDFLAGVAPRHQPYYSALMADFRANRDRRDDIFQAAENARQDFFRARRQLRP